MKSSEFPHRFEIGTVIEPFGAIIDRVLVRGKSMYWICDECFSETGHGIARLMSEELLLERYGRLKEDTEKSSSPNPTL